MTLRDPKKCEICGELFLPRQGRSTICAHPECKKIRGRELSKAPHRNGKRKYTSRHPLAFTCIHCGATGTTSNPRRLFCSAPRCQEASKRRRYLLVRERFIANYVPKNSKLVREVPCDKIRQDAVRSLEPKPSLMAQILEGWINTIFTERDQVELVFLESSHLRGCRNSLISSDLCYNGGYIGEGIFPNRGARA